MVDHTNSAQPSKSFYGSSDGQGSQMIDAFALLRVLRIHKWMLLVLALAGTVLGFLIGLGLTPQYTAIAEILIEPDENNISADNNTPNNQVGESLLETEVEFLSSRSYMKRIVQEVGVFEDIPDGQGGNGLSSEASSPWSFVGQAFAWFGTNADGTSSSSTGSSLKALEERIELFAENYIVRVVGNSQVIEIIYASSDPEEAAEVVNLAAKIHIAEKIGIKQNTNSGNSEWIAGRVIALRDELNAAEREIEKFRAAYNLQTENFDAKTEELSGFVVELIKLKAELAREQTRLDSLISLRSKKQSLLNLPEISSAQTIADLRVEQREVQQRKAELGNTYGERHPEMVAATTELENIAFRIEQEIDRIMQNFQDSVDILRGQKAALEAEITASRSQYAAQSEVEVQLREHERNAEATRELYEDFLQRSKTLNEERLAIDSDIVQLSEASPPALSDTPSSELTALIGFCLAFLGGSMVAVLREHQDQRLRSEHQITNHLGLRTMGAIPQMNDLRRRQSGDGHLGKRLWRMIFSWGGGKQQRLHEYMLEKPMSAYTDAMRNVFLDLRSGMKSKGIKIVVTTSTLPNEGKTTFAVSLAALAADSGLKTLIIDLDLRRPSVHQELKVKKVPSGIKEYIQGEKSLDKTIWKHPQIARLDAVLSMTPQANPIDALESQALSDMLKQARESYDLVVIDSAPLFAVSEAKIVAAIGDAVLFVTRWGSTDHETAQGGLQKLNENNIDNVFGAVLSQVDLNKHHLYQHRDAGHYYKQYKGYYVN